jgi:hypothetical protein
MSQGDCVTTLRQLRTAGRPEEARAAEAREWLARAHADLRAADADLAVSPPLLDDVAFHSQQAVEKSLNAYLAWHDQPFHKTHDIVELGALCMPAGMLRLGAAPPVLSPLEIAVLPVGRHLEQQVLPRSRAVPDQHPVRIRRIERVGLLRQVEPQTPTRRRVPRPTSIGYSRRRH